MCRWCSAGPTSVSGEVPGTAARWRVERQKATISMGIHAVSGGCVGRAVYGSAAVVYDLAWG